MVVAVVVVVVAVVIVAMIFEAVITYGNLDAGAWFRQIVFCVYRTVGSSVYGNSAAGRQYSSTVVRQLYSSMAVR